MEKNLLSLNEFKIKSQTLFNKENANVFLTPFQYQFGLFTE